jgi:opacity protein-like surface antigen
MKAIFLFLSISTVLLAQPLSFGIKAGVPMTDFLDTASGSQTSITSTTNRYIVGPTLELKLPLGFGVEVDALYRHFRYNSVASLVDAVSTLNTSGGAWEFPILVKKRLLRGPIRPFVDAGISFNKIAGLSQTVETVVFPNRVTSTTNSSPAELKDSSSSGFTMGGGVEIKALLLRVTPEIRYTRWSTQHFNATIFNGSLGSNLNQAEFLVGFTF